MQIRSGWHVPPGAVEEPISATPGDYDFSGINLVTYNGVQMSPQAALDAERHLDGLILGQIPPGATRIPGRAHIVVPDHDRVRLLAIQTLHQPGGSAVEYSAEQWRLSLHLQADAIIRSRLFAAADLVEQNDTAAPDDGGADYLIWYRITSLTPGNTGPWLGHWEMRRAGGTVIENVNDDPGTAPGPARIVSLIRGLQFLTQHPASAGYGAPDTSGRAASSGSGIVVDAGGHILTANHVIAACPDLRITSASGTSDQARLVAADTVNDLALLRTERRWSAWARFRKGPGLRPGDPVIVTGFPLSGLVSPEMAVTTGSLTALAGSRGDSAQIEFSAPIQPGNSGGPVLDDTGQVVGVTRATLNGLAVAAAVGVIPENVNFAVKADVAADFLAAHQVAAEAGSGRPAMGPGAVGDLARGFTVRIECLR
jgi:S1-C subfamily serine protease